MPDLFEHEFFAMGCPCALVLHKSASLDLPAAIAAAIGEVRRIEHRYSRYDPASDLSAINRIAAAGGSACVDDETADLIDEAFGAFVRSDGLFDITSGLLRNVWNDATTAIPSPDALTDILCTVGLDKVDWRRPTISFPVAGLELDFGGLAKEYAADRAAAILREAGVAEGLVSLGGDIAIVGPLADGAPWRIGVRSPTDDAAMATLFLTEGAIATSGEYERFWEIDGRRYSHVLDPRTGMPVEGLISATVVAERCLSAGVVATTALLAGANGPTSLAALGLPHLYVDRAGRTGGSIVLR